MTLQFKKSKHNKIFLTSAPFLHLLHQQDLSGKVFLALLFYLLLMLRSYLVIFTFSISRFCTNISVQIREKLESKMFILLGRLEQTVQWSGRALYNAI